MMTPLYRSFTILYPSKSNSRDKHLEEFAFGYEVQAEQLIQLLNSDMIMDSINGKFRLAEHYGVDTDRPDWYDHFIRTAYERIEFEKTPHSSVAVTVVDKDPVLAADIANEISRLVNVVNAQIVTSNAHKVLDDVREEYRARSGVADFINDSIIEVREGLAGRLQRRLGEEVRLRNQLVAGIRDSLDRIRRRHNIFDYGFQVNVLNEELAAARSSLMEETGRLEVLKESPSLPDSMRLVSQARLQGARKRVEYFEQQLKALSAVNAQYTDLSDRLAQELQLLSQTRAELQRLSSTLEPNVDSRNLLTLERNYDWDRGRALELKQKYLQATSNLLDPPPAAYVITRARPSYRKVSPNTRVNVILGTLGALLFAIVGVAFYEKVRDSRIA